jgi:hypothetical protein
MDRATRCIEVEDHALRRPFAGGDIEVDEYLPQSRIIDADLVVAPIAALRCSLQPIEVRLVGEGETLLPAA